MNSFEGLTSAEAAKRLKEDGPNEVPEKKPHPFIHFARKFWGLSAWMLELIALLSWILHKRADLVVAFSLLLVNALLSFFQEQRASTAVDALQSLKHQLSIRGLFKIWKTASLRKRRKGIAFEHKDAPMGSSSPWRILAPESIARRYRTFSIAFGVPAPLTG